ncbi:MAG: hypothetical protein RR342_03260 [Bacilli bacterium]
MQNIYELVGIVKGINFDGVVNNKEVAHLQSWIDKNKNLVYDPRQEELIRLVNSVLEDHIIDEKERIMMLEYSEMLLKDYGDNDTIINELNGIIEGIVCDGVVNEAEVYQLKEWMNLYGKGIKHNKFYSNLFILINNIIEDGVVDEKEQSILLNILAERIANSQFETNLNYLCKQVKERKNIGIDLIDILDNETAMNEIHKRAENQLMISLSSKTEAVDCPEIIMISLVLIAMLEYDGNYYGSVRKTYITLYKEYSEAKVEGLIRSILSRYKKSNDSSSRSRIINVALENAIVPQTFLTAFFEFIVDIYKLNFEFDLSEEIYEDFKFVFDGLRSKMLSDGDNITIKVTNKTYKLIASTKRLITSEDGIDALIKLSVLIAKIVDNRLWDKEVKIYNPYLKAGFEGWVSQLNDEVKHKRNNKEKTTKDRSKWEPKFMLNNNIIQLMPPTHRIKAQYNYKDIAMIILNNGEELYREEKCDIREIIGGYLVNPVAIKLEKPLGQLTYKLTAGDEIIYDSKEILYRNYIIFNEEGREIHNNRDYEGIAYICYMEGTAEINKIFSKEFYNLGSKLVRIGDAISISNDVFNFSSMINPGIIGRLHDNCEVINDRTQESMQVYKEVNVVVFEADNLSSKFEIIINGKSHKISDMKYKKTTRDSISKYVVELKLLIVGIYEIKVNQLIIGKKKEILNEQFIYDPTLEYMSETQGGKTFRIMASSGFLLRKINTEISSIAFQADFIKFKINGEVYSYMLPFELNFYKFGDNRWKSGTEEIWIDDIQLDTDFILYNSKCDALSIYNEGGKIIEDNISFVNKGYYKKFSIGFLNSFKKGNRCVYLVFTGIDQMRHVIPCFNSCVIDEEKSEFICFDDPKQLKISTVFHGKNKVFFEVFNNEGNKIFSSQLLESGQTEYVNTFDSFKEYTIIFYEKIKKSMIKANSQICCFKKTFYAKQDFINKSFKINEIFFNPINMSNKYEFLEKSYYLNKAYIHILDRLESDIFRGEIFVNTINGKWFLDEINPVIVEICSSVIDDTIDLYITNEEFGDGLLVDSKKHGILNSLDQRSAPDIFLFTVSVNGGIKS